MSLTDQQATYYRDPDTGHLMMPGTKRPDGSWRKPRRIKEGYVPQDEVPLYESKGKQFAKSRESNPIPGLSGSNGGGGIFDMKIDTFDHKALMRGPPKIPGLPDSIVLGPSNVDLSAMTKKSNKKKKKQQPQSSTFIAPAVKPESIVVHETYQASDSEANVDPAKKLRNLKKKLRDIETLEAKLADGSLPHLEPEQLEKVARKSVMLEEIAQLEDAVAKIVV